MQDCRSPVVEKMSNPIQFLQVRSVISTQSSSASLNRKEGGRKEEKSGIVAKPVGATPAANEDAHRVSLRVDSIFPVFFSVFLFVCV